MRRILVTGGAGFIGSNFVHYMLGKHDDILLMVLDALTYAGNLDNLRPAKADKRLMFFRGDIRDEGMVNGLMSNVDYVVHFAAETHVDRSILDAGVFIDTDVYGTFVLLEAARNADIKRFVHISTDEVYGEAPGRPSVETDALMPKSPYAASKAGADRLAFSYFTTYGLPVVISRCSNNYGPFQYPEKLIPLFVTNALENKPLPVYGNGKSSRDWIYVLDHCRAIDALLWAEGVEGEAYNIGATTELNVLEITDIILNQLKKPKSLIKHVDDRLGHVARHAVDASKINKKLGWKPEYDLKENIESTIRWYIENEEWWRRVKAKHDEYLASIEDRCNHGH
jgi:dTDP-glucose 4,6-dehydratase